MRFTFYEVVKRRAGMHPSSDSDWGGSRAPPVSIFMHNRLLAREETIGVTVEGHANDETVIARSAEGRRSPSWPLAFLAKGS
jgi:hypothetical protein